MRNIYATHRLVCAHAYVHTDVCTHTNTRMLIHNRQHARTAITTRMRRHTPTCKMRILYRHRHACTTLYLLGAIAQAAVTGIVRVSRGQRRHQLLHGFECDHGVVELLLDHFLERTRGCVPNICQAGVENTLGAEDALCTAVLFVCQAVRVSITI